MYKLGRCEQTPPPVWKCLHDAAPRYLVDLCVPARSVHGRQQLRSTASGTPLVPRARTATSHRSFAVNGSGAVVIV